MLDLFHQTPGTRNLRVAALAGGLLLAGLVLWLSFQQGLTWDEPWLLEESRRLACRQGTAPFKPLAGLLLLPFVPFPLPWPGVRALFLVVQAGLALALWRLMPRAWGRFPRLGLLAFLWLEPTFRERVLEARTDGPAMLLLLLGTLAWHRSRGLRDTLLAAGALGLALALAPKTVLWILPWLLATLLLPARSVRRSLLAAFSVGALFLVLWSLPVLWRGQGLPGLLAASASANATGVTGQGLLAPTTLYYLRQTVLLGLPFWAAALAGLLDLLRSRRLQEGPWGHWELAGLGAALTTPFYQGAFPYHYVGIILGLLPLAARGLSLAARRLDRWTFPAALGLSCLFALHGLLPVLEGPRVSEQLAFARAMGSWLPPGQGYVDAVGLLGPGHLAPFATARGVQEGGGAGQWQVWQREKLGLLHLNGRSEMFLQDPGNGRWLSANLVCIHPMVALVGTGGILKDGEASLEWTCPWDTTLVLQGDPASRWTLNGEPCSPGSPLPVSAGPLKLEARGAGKGPFLLYQWPSRPPRPLPPFQGPFFLPFQRI